MKPYFFLVLLVILITANPLLAQSKKKQIDVLLYKIDSLSLIIDSMFLEGESLKTNLLELGDKNASLNAQISELNKSNQSLKNQFDEVTNNLETCQFALRDEENMNVLNYEISNLSFYPEFIWIPDLRNYVPIGKFENLERDIKNTLVLEKRNGFIYSKNIPKIPISRNEEDSLENEILITKYSEETMLYLNLGEPSVQKKMKEQNLSSSNAPNTSSERSSEDTIYFESKDVLVKVYFMHNSDAQKQSSVRSKNIRLICESTVNNKTKKHVLMSISPSESATIICIDDITDDGTIDLLVSRKTVGEGYFESVYLFSHNSRNEFSLSSYGNGYIFAE